MYDILHIIFFGLFNLVSGVLIGLIVGSDDE